MNVGAFSISLAVKDIAKSKEFYEKIGFSVMGGDQEQNWLIMKNDQHVIGLFQGMFEKNCLTFNPGWDQEGKDLDSFTDVRKIHETLQQQGVTVSELSGGQTGPASFTAKDPDGNPVLFDQHR